MWGDLEQPFVGFKVASMTYRKRLKTEPENVDKIDKDPEQKPKWLQESGNPEDEMQAIQESKVYTKVEINHERLKELNSLLTFIDEFADVKGFFD